MKVAILLCFVFLLATCDYAEDIEALHSRIQKENKGLAYEILAQISDTFGPRLWGSEALESTIHFLYKQAKKQGFDNVRLQTVKNFTKWVRGEQSLILHEPRIQPMNLKVIGLGGTVPGDVTAEGFVVRDFNQLQKNKDKVKNKIVIYNQPWTNYDDSVTYRSQGASKAAQYGARAALVRSVTPDSIESVHAGIQHYDDRYAKIPVAAIATEDAEMFQRMQQRNQTFRLTLSLKNSLHENTFSNNLIFEIRGTEFPQQILLLGGHIDSWDTGSQTGTNDDGGGFISCYQALKLIKDSGLKPKRTLRFIAWSGEEWGSQKNGAHAYLYTHRNELKNHIVAFEDDLGSTKLLGFGFSQVPGREDDIKIVENLSKTYLQKYNISKVTDDGEAVDTGILFDIGIPTMINLIEDTEDHHYYFTYHHSAGDSITMMSEEDLDSNVFGIASIFYLLASSEQSLPLPNINQAKLNEYINNYRNAQ